MRAVIVGVSLVAMAGATNVVAEAPTGAAAALVTPAGLTVTAQAGTQASAALVLGNGGSGTLSWNLRQAPAQSHFPSGTSPHLPLPNPPLPAGTTIPTYALNNTGAATTYIFEDALHPENLTTIGPAPSGTWVSGTFIGDDFAHHYMLESHWQVPTYALIAMDTATGQNTQVTTFPLTEGQWAGITWDATTSTLFGVACAESTGCTLYTLDPATGTTTRIGQIVGAEDPSGQISLLDLTVDSAGRLYGINFFTRSLYAIDKTSGVSQTIGALGVAETPMYIQSIDFDKRNDTLYWYAFVSTGGPNVQGRIYTIDPSTGAATQQTLIPGPAEQFAAAIATVGPCAAPSTVPWLATAEISGSTAPGAESSVAVTLDASTLAPGTYTTQVCVYSNDASQGLRAEVPVTFTVTPATLFADGFEAD